VHKSVLFDTSFLIRLLTSTDNLHINAKEYFKHFLDNDYRLICSTISIGEYCVRGDIDELPLRNMQILPYNYDHSLKAASFAKLIFELKSIDQIELPSRLIIQNDTKLFAQAETEKPIAFYLTSDTSSRKIYDKLNERFALSFKFIDINEKLSSTLGMFDFQ